jgi:hypothetical protein
MKMVRYDAFPTLHWNWMTMMTKRSVYPKITLSSIQAPACGGHASTGIEDEVVKCPGLFSLSMKPMV